MAIREKVLCRYACSWFVNSQSVQAALSENMMAVQDNKQLPNDVTSACLDENINIHCIRKYFCLPACVPAWKEVLAMITKVREQVWLRRICCKAMDTKVLRGSQLIVEIYRCTYMCGNWKGTQVQNMV